jgi:hypothetical protein
VIHPALTYLIDSRGQIVFATLGDPDILVELGRRLDGER